MASTYKTIYTAGEGEIEEKKSRFIAHARPVHSEEEASAFIAEMKKKYWDSRHNCSAFIVGENSEIARSSDDGEPSGTAGKPILEVIMGEGLTDTAIVVTRYFGGTLLGTGGLIRAYTQATKAALSDCTIIEKKAGYLLSLKTDYTEEGKIRYYLRENDLPLKDSIYTDKVDLITVVSTEDEAGHIKKLTELVNGKITISRKDNVVFAVADNEIIIF